MLSNLRVTEQEFQVPIGPWAKDKAYKTLGAYFEAQILDVIEPVTLALFTRVLSHSPDEISVMIANAKNDIRKQDAHIWVPIHFIWGKKPD